MNSFYALLLGLIGAIIYRFRGHASKYKKYYPRPASQITFSLPYAIIAYLSAGLWVGGLVLILTTLAILTGRGNFFPKVPFKSPYKPETLESPILFLRGKIPDCLYKSLGMAIVGMAATFPCGVSTLNPFIALSGALMAPAYMIGRVIYDVSPKVPKKDSSGNSYMGVKYLPRHLDYGTEIGEFLTGLFLWTSLFLI